MVCMCHAWSIRFIQKVVCFILNVVSFVLTMVRFDHGSFFSVVRFVLNSCIWVLRHSYIFSTARGFKKIAGKGDGVEYLILNFYLPRGHVKSNVQMIGDIISFRIYYTYFHHDIRGHCTGVMLPRSMHVNCFFF